MCSSFQKSFFIDIKMIKKYKKGYLALKKKTIKKKSKNICSFFVSFYQSQKQIMLRDKGKSLKLIFVKIYERKT